MKGLKIFLPALALIGALGLDSANAQHRHHGHGHSRTNVGFVFGGPGYGPYYGVPYPYYYYPYYPPYYSYPYYGYPPMIAVQTSPPVYVERGQDEAEEEYYWYYCSNPKGYYPYVRTCNTNWQRVTPVPQSN